MLAAYSVLSATSHALVIKQHLLEAVRSYTLHVNDCTHKRIMCFDVKDDVIEKSKFRIIVNSFWI